MKYRKSGWARTAADAAGLLYRTVVVTVNGVAGSMTSAGDVICPHAAPGGKHGPTVWGDPDNENCAPELSVPVMVTVAVSTVVESANLSSSFKRTTTGSKGT